MYCLFLRKIVFGGCSSGVEPRIVTPVVVGSNPIIHPSDNVCVTLLGCGGCSSVVEPRIVTPVVVGSSPIIHPITPAIPPCFFPLIIYLL